MTGRVTLRTRAGEGVHPVSGRFDQLHIQTAAWDAAADGAWYAPAHASTPGGERPVRRRNGAAWRYHDLGLLWQQHTGLPFVFAVWAVSERASPSVFDALRVIKAEGLAARKQIALQEPDPDFALHYLTNCIRYDVGSAEKMGIRRFENL